MRLFKVTLTETVKGVAEVAALDEDHAEKIALAVLLDDGITSFSDLRVIDREFEVEMGDGQEEKKED